MNIAATVALDKLRNPSAFCPSRRCLWRTGGGWCPRHSAVDTLVPQARITAITDYGMSGARDAIGRRPPQARFRSKLVATLADLNLNASVEPMLARDAQTGLEIRLSINDEGGTT